MAGFEAADFVVFAPGFAWAAAPVAARETANSATANTAKVRAMAFDGWSGRKSCGGYGFRNSVIPTPSRRESLTKSFIQQLGQGFILN